MKKNLLILMTTVSAVFLTACGAKVPALSKMDNNKAAEYMAGELLKYDEDYAFSLDYDRSVLYVTPTPVPTPTPAPESQGKEDGKNGGTSAAGKNGQTGSSTGEAPAMQEVSLSDVYGLNGVTVNVGSSALQKSYGKGYESFVASQGKKLLIVYFKVKNTTDADQKVDLTKNKMQYQLSIDGKTVSPSQSIARGDLLAFENKIPAGKSEQGILMFEVDKNATVDGSSLMVMNGTKRATVSLK